MKETDLQIQSTPPNFELSLDPDELRIILADYQQKIENLKNQNSKLTKERDARVPSSFYSSTIAVLGLLAVIFILINRCLAYDEGYSDGKERVIDQLEKLQQTYCLEKHQSSSAYQACFKSI